MVIDGGAQKNSESVLIYVGICVRTGETQMGFEVNEPML